MHTVEFHPQMEIETLMKVKNTFYDCVWLMHMYEWTDRVCTEVKRGLNTHLSNFTLI